MTSDTYDRDCCYRMARVRSMFLRRGISSVRPAISHISAVFVFPSRLRGYLRFTILFAQLDRFTPLINLRLRLAKPTIRQAPGVAVRATSVSTRLCASPAKRNLPPTTANAAVHRTDYGALSSMSFSFPSKPARCSLAVFLKGRSSRIVRTPFLISVASKS